MANRNIILTRFEGAHRKASEPIILKYQILQNFVNCESLDAAVRVDNKPSGANFTIRAVKTETNFISESNSEYYHHEDFRSDRNLSSPFAFLDLKSMYLILRSFSSLLFLSASAENNLIQCICFALHRVLTITSFLLPFAAIKENQTI